MPACEQIFLTQKARSIRTRKWRFRTRKWRFPGQKTSEKVILCRVVEALLLLSFLPFFLFSSHCFSTMSSPVPRYESAPPPSGDEFSMSSDSSGDNARPSASPTRGSFQEWFENDLNVVPNQILLYLMMMMTTIDYAFDLNSILKQMQNKKKNAKPKLDFHKQEFMRRSAKMGLLGSTQTRRFHKCLVS